MDLWNLGIMEIWSYGDLEFCNYGFMDFFVYFCKLDFFLIIISFLL